MAKFDPPWRLDPLKNIVGVGWNGAFVAIQFRADASGPSPTSVDPLIQLNDIGASVPIFGSGSTSFARHPKPVYHVDTTEHKDGHHVISQHYTILVTYTDGHGGSGNAGGDIYVTTSDGVSYWSGFAGGTDHLGDIGAAGAFFLSNGWNTFSSTLIDTTENTGGPTDSRSITSVGVLIISVAAVRAKMTDKEAKSFTIEWDTGFSSGTFGWRATVGTYRKVTFDSFPLNEFNEPVNWKTPIDSNTEAGSSSKHLRYSIDFKTLKITHT